MAELPDLRLMLLVGRAAMAWHLGKGPVKERVRGWRDGARRGIWALPHPSWRNTGWLKANPWFEAELLPELRAAVRKVMDDRSD
jgi:uracil-DNA glycosylase